jgi:adenosylhomocysteine nucleosidase|tara:strand:- start:555 stop:1244 length:690 start_codon:yes stop_codon:yes gene_type:complete
MKTHGIVVSGVHSGMETVQSQDIKIKQTGLETKKASIKNGVWLATYKEETKGNNWFKHTGPSKINATYVTLLAVQAYTMVKGKLPAYVCNYSTAKATGDTVGFHEFTRFIHHDLYIGNEQYETPGDTVAGKLGNERGLTIGTRDDIVSKLHLDPEISAVDTTTYAIAKICLEMKINFRCYKYVTNNLPYIYDKEHDDWLKDCDEGARLLRKMCEGRFGDVPPRKKTNGK